MSREPKRGNRDAENTYRRRSNFQTSLRSLVRLFSQGNLEYERSVTNATYDGRPLFRGEMRIWIWWKLAMSEGLKFALFYAESLLVVGGRAATVAVNVVCG